MKTFTITTIIASLLAGCAGDGFVNEAGKPKKQAYGTLIGAAGGALIGSQFGGGAEGHFAGAAIGGLIGAFAGNAIGKSMDDRDIQYYQQTTQTALEYNRSGVASSWHNPDSGHSGVITPTKTYSHNQRYCREYTQSIKVGNKVQEAYGKACRQPDGSWEIVG